MHGRCWCCPSANPLFAKVCLGCGHDLWKDRALDLLFIAALIVCLMLLRQAGPPTVP